MDTLERERPDSETVMRRAPLSLSVYLLVSADRAIIYPFVGGKCILEGFMADIAGSDDSLRGMPASSAAWKNLASGMLFVFNGSNHIWREKGSFGRMV